MNMNNRVENSIGQMEEMRLQIKKLEEENNHMKSIQEKINNIYMDSPCCIDYFDQIWRKKTFCYPEIPISDEMANFLGKEPGTEISRHDLTREINKYIGDKKLPDKENYSIINPDNALSTLLKIGDDEVLTYFNLQKYLNQHHYVRKPSS